MQAVRELRYIAQQPDEIDEASEALGIKEK